jgi:(p)ppGpp synthase/HD superfamily hydrolase
MKKGEMLGRALVLATNAHSGQFDKGGSPYILHPLKVLYYIKSDDEELQCIAILHDVIEDTNTKYSDLYAAGFSERIVTGVRALTKQPGQTLDEYKEVIFANNDAMLVKLADLRHNSDIRRLKGITEKDIIRLSKYHHFYMEIKSRLG